MYSSIRSTRCCCSFVKIKVLENSKKVARMADMLCDDRSEQNKVFDYLVKHFAVICSLNIMDVDFIRSKLRVD